MTAATSSRDILFQLPLCFFFIQMFYGVGVKGNLCQPTYVYPEEVKMLIRSAFSQNICDYLDPCNDQVSVSTFTNSAFTSAPQITDNQMVSGFWPQFSPSSYSSNNMYQVSSVFSSWKNVLWCFKGKPNPQIWNCFLINKKTFIKPSHLLCTEQCNTSSQWQSAVACIVHHLFIVSVWQINTCECKM